MLFWTLLASGQITMRKVDGLQSLAQRLAHPPPVELAAAASRLARTSRRWR